MMRTVSMPDSMRPIGDRPISRLGVALAIVLLVSGAAFAQSGALPADAMTAKQRLDASSRHGEWVDGEGPGADAGTKDKVRAWVSYPERETKALLDRGLALRREVLGADYVDGSLKAANDFTMAFQHITTEWFWGYAW